MATVTYTIGAPIVPTGGGGVLAQTVAQSRVPCDGGHRLDLTGIFPIGYPLEVYIGMTGTVEDAQCVSGKPGQGKTIYPIDAGHLYCYTPRLPIGGPFSVMVRSPLVGSESIIPAALTTIRPDYRTSVFNIRAMFPNIFLVGSRTIEDVPPISMP